MTILDGDNWEWRDHEDGTQRKECPHCARDLVREGPNQPVTHLSMDEAMACSFWRSRPNRGPGLEAT